MTGPNDKIAVWALIAGFTLWAFAFVALYALQALGCAYGWPQHRPILILAYLVSLVAMGGLVLWTERGRKAGTLVQAAIWANRAALASTALIFLPVFFTSPCAA